MAKWYIKRNGKQAGPFESAQLKQLAADGKIKPDDQIRREDQETWHKAGAVKGLLIGCDKSAATPEATPEATQAANTAAASQESPPTPVASPSTSGLPWYHPASLLFYALCFSGLYYFNQNRQVVRTVVEKSEVKQKDQEDEWKSIRIGGGVFSKGIEVKWNILSNPKISSFELEDGGFVKRIKFVQDAGSRGSLQQNFSFKAFDKDGVLVDSGNVIQAGNQGLVKCYILISNAESVVKVTLF